MRIHTRLLLPLLGLAAACGGTGSTDSGKQPENSAQAPASSQLPSDNTVLALLYSGTYTVPNGFFVDERASTTGSYTVHHVIDSSGSYELCTDDFDTALGWEDADNASRSVNGPFVASYENERYFEFVRDLSYDNDIGNIDDLTSPGFARVFKCSYTNRDGVDRALLNGYAGTLYPYPMTDHTIRVFTEYLWQFTFFPNSRKVVLDSVSTEADGDLQHTLLLAFATSQGTERCDRVEIVEWHHRANTDTGTVTRDFDAVRTFEARFEQGSATRCD